MRKGAEVGQSIKDIVLMRSRNGELDEDDYPDNYDDDFIDDRPEDELEIGEEMAERNRKPRSRDSDLDDSEEETSNRKKKPRKTYSRILDTDSDEPSDFENYGAKNRKTLKRSRHIYGGIEKTNNRKRSRILNVLDTEADDETKKSNALNAGTSAQYGGGANWIDTVVDLTGGGDIEEGIKEDLMLGIIPNAQNNGSLNRRQKFIGVG